MPDRSNPHHDTTPIGSYLMDGATGGGRRGARLSRLSWAAMAASAGVLACVGVWSATQATNQERAIAGAWSRAVEADPSLVPAFELGQARDHLLPASSTEPAKPLVVGDRVTVLTPDGAILTLRVCDPASPSASTTADCLNAFVSRAVQPVAAPIPQRSL